MSRSARTARALVLASTVATATAAAQSVTPYYGVGVGATVPTGDFHADQNGDGFNAGWHGLALVGFNLPKVPVGLRVEGAYNQNPANDRLKAAVSALTGAPADGKTKLLGGNVDVTSQFGISSRAKAYVLGGIGIENVKVSITSRGVANETSETKFAWNVGAGLTYSIGGAALFLEARYFKAADPYAGGFKIAFFPITAGIRFGGK
jgi:opacity protein-like surface antigen